MFCEPGSAADTSCLCRMSALFCSSSIFPFESVLIATHQQIEFIFLVTGFQDAAWPKPIPRTEAVKETSTLSSASLLWHLPTLQQESAQTKTRPHTTEGLSNAHRELPQQHLSTLQTPGVVGSLQHRAVTLPQNVLMQENLPTAVCPGS